MYERKREICCCIAGREQVQCLGGNLVAIEVALQAGTETAKKKLRKRNKK